jgi:hypothetical protein
MSHLQSTQPCPIKGTDSVSNSKRADAKALENAETGKVTAVVAVMHLYGDTTNRSISDNAKISASKTKLESKSKKLDLKRSKKGLKEAKLPPKHTSNRLVDKHKTIRVLLDTGSSGVLLFLEKGSNKYTPVVRGLFQNHRTLPMAPSKLRRWVKLSLPLLNIQQARRRTCTQTS